MKINPDSPDFQPQVEPPATPGSGKAFGDTLTSKAQQKVAEGSTQVPAAPNQGISRSDLANPAQVNLALDRAVQDLIEKEFGGMCTPDRERVADWLRSDPMMRAALLQRQSG